MQNSPARPTPTVPCQWEGCGLVFEDELSCYSHLCQVHCQIDDKVGFCRWRITLINHLHQHHSSHSRTDTGPLSSFCNVEFTNKKGLSEHALTHFTLDMKPIQCAICLVRLRNRQALRKHRLAVHASAMVPSSSLQQQQQQQQLITTTTTTNILTSHVGPKIITYYPHILPSLSYSYFPLRTSSLPTPPTMEIGIHPKYAINKLVMNDRGGSQAVPAVFWNMLKAGKERERERVVKV